MRTKSKNPAKTTQVRSLPFWYKPPKPVKLNPQTKFIPMQAKITCYTVVSLYEKPYAK